MTWVTENSWVSGVSGHTLTLTQSTRENLLNKEGHISGRSLPNTAGMFLCARQAIKQQQVDTAEGKTMKWL